MDMKALGCEAVEDELMWQRIAAHESGHGTKSEGALRASEPVVF